tara:strand:+ start:229 stop:591 length:363 start_codon:yes stop_codon:yes gene_type:complete
MTNNIKNKFSIAIDAISSNNLFKTSPNNFDDKLFSQERTVIVNIKKAIPRTTEEQIDSIITSMEALNNQYLNKEIEYNEYDYHREICDDMLYELNPAPFHNIDEEASNKFFSQVPKFISC